MKNQEYQYVEYVGQAGPHRSDIYKKDDEGLNLYRRRRNLSTKKIKTITQEELDILLEKKRIEKNENYDSYKFLILDFKIFKKETKNGNLFVRISDTSECFYISDTSECFYCDVDYNILRTCSHEHNEIDFVDGWDKNWIEEDISREEHEKILAAIRKHNEDNNISYTLMVDHCGDDTWLEEDVFFCMTDAEERKNELRHSLIDLRVDVSAPHIEPEWAKEFDHYCKDCNSEVAASYTDSCCDVLEYFCSQCEGMKYES